MKKSYRLLIGLDSEDKAILESLARDLRMSRSAIVRFALRWIALNSAIEDQDRAKKKSAEGERS